MRVIELEDGKYKIYAHENYIATKIDRYDEEWIDSMYGIKGSNCWHALIWEYLKLKDLYEGLKP
jgi:hypothetical protein